MEIIKAVGRSAKRVGRGENPVATKEQAAERMAICTNCDSLRNDKCIECGCFMKVKTKVAEESCPIGKWLKIVPDVGGKVLILVNTIGTEPHLEKTINELQIQAQGEVQIIKYDSWDHKSDAQFIMSVDAPIKMSKGYDLALKYHCRANTVCVPRLRTLIPGSWISLSRYHDFQYFDKNYKINHWEAREPKKTETELLMTHTACGWMCNVDLWNRLGDTIMSGMDLTVKVMKIQGRQLLVKSAVMDHHFKALKPYTLGDIDCTSLTNKFRR